nr:hypothetical protein BaRGS_008558 [Batillaria attramentaria]
MAGARCVCVTEARIQHHTPSPDMEPAGEKEERPASQYNWRRDTEPFELPRRFVMHPALSRLPILKRTRNLRSTDTGQRGQPRN